MQSITLDVYFPPQELPKEGWLVDIWYRDKDVSPYLIHSAACFRDGVFHVVTGQKSVVYKPEEIKGWIHQSLDNEILRVLPGE